MVTPLEGITVLDLSQGVAGPYCTKLLALWGAEVIKVEPPGSGDIARRLGPFVHDDPQPEKSLLYLYLNTSKKSITLDVKPKAGRDLLRDLVESADVLVESFEPSVLPGLGLGYAALSDLNPKLVMTSVSFFGQSGPYKDYKGEEIVAQAVSGNLQITGEPDREPVKIGGYFAQYTAGQAAYVATLMALYHAQLTGKGQQVDCSIPEPNTDLLDSWGVNAVLGVKQPRTGMRHHGAYPAQIFPCKDGYVAIGTGPAGWEALVDLVGNETLRDPKYQAVATRKNYREEIDAIFLDWLKDRTKLEVFHAGQAKRLAFGYLMTPKDMLESPQLQARAFFQELEHPIAGRASYPGPPFQFSDTQWTLSRAPLLGEHNQEVYQQRLGISQGDLILLRQQGVI